MTLAGDPKKEEYRGQALKLLPPGSAWTRRTDSTLAKLLHGLAGEAAQGDERGVDLIRESDPRTTSELLTDWERVLGLPDPCATLQPTEILRRFAVVQKLTGKGGQSPQYYIDQAAALGFTITIEEVCPFEVGKSVVGDRLTVGDQVFVWFVHAPPLTPMFARAGQATAGDPLVSASNDILECVIRDLAPAHTRVFFIYDGAYTGYSPWETIIPDPAQLDLTLPLTS